VSVVDELRIEHLKRELIYQARGCGAQSSRRVRACRQTLDGAQTMPSQQGRHDHGQGLGAVSGRLSK
jgi:hypothetical protein